MNILKWAILLALLSSSTICWGQTNINVSSIDNIIYVDGSSKYPLTDAGIQSAINAAPDGGQVNLGPGTYTLCNSLPITITKRINIIGSGWGTVLQLCSTASATTDVFLLKPSNSSDVHGARFAEFFIQPQSGTPGRHGFNIDGTNASFAYIEWDHVFINTLGNYAIAVTNAGSNANGTPYTSSIRDCKIYGGILLTNLGDDILIQRNTLSGPRDVNITATPVGRSGVDGGAHSLIVEDNDITTAGGIVIVNAWQGMFRNNDVEAIVTSTEANNALLDLQGNTSPGPPQDFIVEGNYLGANSAFVGDNIRVDKMTHAIIRSNYLTSASSNRAVLITSNAIDTELAGNIVAPTGNLITTWLSDSGTSTFGYYTNPATPYFPVNIGPFAFSATNSVNRYFGGSGTQVKVGSGIPFGWASGTDVSSTGLDTACSRIQANFIGCGNGTVNDVSGSFLVANYYTGGSTQHLFLSSTSPTIAAAGCGGTNSTISAPNGTASFEILIGSGGATAGGCTVTMPAATTSWTCDGNTVGATSATNYLVKQTGAISTTSVVIQNFSDAAVATAFAASDTVRVKCLAN